jgi:hypothetical protein
MDAAVVAVVACAAVAVVAAVTAGACLGVLRRVERQRDGEAEATRAELGVLLTRVEELSRELERTRRQAVTVLPSSGLSSSGLSSSGLSSMGLTSSGPVITPAGSDAAARDRAVVRRSDRPQVPEGAVLSVTLGEPLVKVAAWAHGIRRALAPETRNRIAFEMRREVKRARKERRRAARRARLSAGAHGRRQRSGAEESAA